MAGFPMIGHPFLGERGADDVTCQILSPRRRLYPPAWKPYGLEAEPEAIDLCCQGNNRGPQYTLNPVCRHCHPQKACDFIYPQFAGGP